MLPSSRPATLTIVTSFPRDATPAMVAKALASAAVRRAVTTSLGPAGRGNETTTDVKVEIKTRLGTVTVVVKRKKKEGK